MTEMQRAHNLSVVMLADDSRIDRRILDEARSLVQAGWQATVIAGPPPAPSDRLDEETYPEVNIIRIDPGYPAEKAQYPTEFQLASIPWNTIASFTDYLYSEAIKYPATVYTAHDYPQLPAALMAATYHQAFFVYDTHEVYPEHTYFLVNNLTSAAKDIEKWLVQFADKVITVNQSIAGYMASLYEIDMPEVILNCMALHQGLTLPIPCNNLLRQELGIPDDKLILLYQGLIEPKRNLEALIQAISLINNPDVVCVLMGPDIYEKDELKNLAQDLHLLDIRVFFQRSVSQSELLRYTASADAGIIPYHFGGLGFYFVSPNKLFEFIVAGLPILANDLPELNRFVSQQQIGLNMPMGTPEQIAIAIDTFFQKDLTVFRKRLLEVSPQFVWETQGRKVVQIYRQILTNSPKSCTTKISPGQWESIRYLISLYHSILQGPINSTPSPSLSPPPPPPPPIVTMDLPHTPTKLLLKEISTRVKRKITNYLK